MVSTTTWSGGTELQFRNCNPDSLRVAAVTYNTYMETYALTFGRLNLPHPGHVNLVQRMLEVADQAVVGVSAGRSNNDVETRIEVMQALCEKAGLPMDRVTFIVASNPYALLDEWLAEETGSGLYDLDRCVSTTVVLGVDQTQLGERLRDCFGVAFVPNEVRVGSSTVIRHFLEVGEEDLVREIYHSDPALFDQIVALRSEELAREKS